VAEGRLSGFENATLVKIKKLIKWCGFGNGFSH